MLGGGEIALAAVGWLAVGGCAIAIGLVIADALGALGEDVEDEEPYGDWPAVPFRFRDHPGLESDGFTTVHCTGITNA